MGKSSILPIRRSSGAWFANIVAARLAHSEAAGTLHREMVAFSALIDARGEEELPQVVGEPVENGDNGA